MTQRPSASPVATTGSGRSLVALVLGAMGIGLAPLFVRWSEVGTCATGFWRLALASPVILIWCVFSGDATIRLARRDWALIFLGGLFFAADLALWHSAIRMTSVANATLETNLSAVLVPIFAWICWRQRPRGAFVLALALALVGVAMLVGRSAHLSTQTLKGDLLGSVSAIFYSGYLLSVKSARQRGAPTAIVMMVSGPITALGLLALALASHESVVPSTCHGWLIVSMLALVSQLGGQCLIAYSLLRLPATFASAALLIQPATAALAAWAVLGESLTASQITGAVILVGGLYLAQRSTQLP